VASRRDVLMLALGIVLALVGGSVWRAVGGAAVAHALDLADVRAEDRLWTAFKDFLKTEDERLRLLAPQGSRQLAHYQSHTHFCERFLVAGEGVVWHEERRTLTAAERIRRVIRELDRDYSGRQPEKAAALAADLRQVLAERAAALEVLRFSTPSYARDLLDPDIKVSWGVLWDSVGKRAYLQGTVDGLYRRRANELLAAVQAED